MNGSIQPKICENGGTGTSVFASEGTRTVWGRSGMKDGGKHGLCLTLCLPERLWTDNMCEPCRLAVQNAANHLSRGCAALEELAGKQRDN